MKTDHEVWPILNDAVIYMNTGDRSPESVDACRHLYMSAWIQIGEDYGKLLPGPNNPMTHAPTGATLSIDLDKKLQNLERFLQIHSDQSSIAPASS